MATAKTRTILDSNVVLDALFAGSAWHQWTVSRMAECVNGGELLINAIVFAEASPRFEDYTVLQRSIEQLSIRFEHLPWAAAYEAGRAHALYRKTGGARERTLPDFFIGAHAKVEGLQLLTRDAARYRSYFPTLDIIAPDTHP